MTLEMSVRPPDGPVRPLSCAGSAADLPPGTMFTLKEDAVVHVVMGALYTVTNPQVLVLDPQRGPRVSTERAMSYPLNEIEVLPKGSEVCFKQGAIN